MSISARSAVPLTVAEVDLLCATADSSPPYPLRVPTHGTSVAERRVVLRQAGEQLAARGLADERGPLGVAEAFAYLLQDSARVLDLLLSTGTDVLAVVLLARRDLAVLVTQRLTGDDDTVAMAELPLDDAVDELIAVVPPREAALTSPFSLPTGLLGRVYQDARRRPTAWDELLAAHGVTDRLARRLVTHLQPVVGNGQAGLATRGGYANAWQRAGDEIRWLDTERGRLQLVAGEDAEWTSVNPMHAADLATALRRLAGALRA
ncbi:ESX secretion-associated protein EspG [Actinophytocola gossypii]|uniref:ESX secretion-associated protein EspG n=1 Tax=Actinophytocola gossypii TaxID=2812003 RepID=A0ABT2JHQ7_9PSEU|nr:ESX secretion-associated protein EspG [Actinophytocola gossypii]MCT2587413.1 ESX secretion-associated protein EspG [Actinophytocola gossypii]